MKWLSQRMAPQDDGLNAARAGMLGVVVGLAMWVVIALLGAVAWWY